MRRKYLLSFILAGLIISNCSNPKDLKVIENPTSIESSLPRLFTDNSGTVFMSWVEQSEGKTTLLYSKFSDNSWRDPVEVAQSNEWFVNWADFPSIIAENGNPMSVHWLKKIPGNTYSYNVEVASFVKGRISKPIVPHNDETATEHGFVSMVPVSDTSYYAIWLDGRNTGSTGHKEHGVLSSSMSLRGAQLTVLGKTLSEAEIDSSVCDCCNTSIAKTNNGLIAAYRNRTKNEVRDIYITKTIDGVWQKPIPVHNDNWKIAACPVNGPAIDVFDKTVSVAWFTGVDDKPKVKLSFSLDEGNSFLPAIDIDSTSVLGRVDIIANDNNSSWISWITRVDDEAQLRLRLISSTGKSLENHIITKMSPSRSSGFPQITKIENGVLIAWTDLSDSGKSIKTAILQ
tara:strand:+ start:2967 stop:4166 length:1200 start_codon:yes stop_codon:yes gene_type:complete